MPKIVVLGAGVCGLAAGMLLRRDGHEVTVLERDPEPPPDSIDEAWERWSRDGVSQFRLAHYMTPRGRIVLEHGHLVAVSSEQQSSREAAHPGAQDDDLRHVCYPPVGRKSISSRLISSGASSCIQWPGPSSRS